MMVICAIRLTNTLWLGGFTKNLLEANILTREKSYLYKNTYCRIVRNLKQNKKQLTILSW